MAKLDPDNWKSAKDVMDERQAAFLKRKREEDEELSDSLVGEPEAPKAEQDQAKPKTKKRKTADLNAQPSTDQDTKVTVPETEDERIQRKKEQKAAKKERKKEKKAKAKEKLDRQKARKQEAKQHQHHETSSKDKTKSQNRFQDSSNSKQGQSSENEENGEDDAAEAIEIDTEDVFTQGTPMLNDKSASSVSEPEVDEVFSPQHDSGNSSISSILLPSTEGLPKVQQPASPPVEATQPTEQITNLQQPLLRSEEQPGLSTPSQDPKERLQAAISAFRAERKADDGPKSRAELLEQRRRQEERRRAEKKEQKRREKEEAARKQEEEIAKRFSPGGSGSLLGSPRSPLIDSDSNNFSFGRVAFGDGSTFDPANSSITDSHKKKGPSDPATALKAAQAKQQRVSGLDEQKRTTIHEKDMWANARKRAAGEKVKDDTSLLKKALKRHEGQKKKSEKEWKDRKEGVQKSVDMKQKKRTDNLAKRKEDKNHNGKKVKRPGFEGSFRGRTGGGKRKA